MEIKRAKPHQANQIFSMYKSCKSVLEAAGIFQWTVTYPSLETVERDINSKTLYSIIQNGECLGSICINSIQEIEYQMVDWACNDGKIMVIHRLAVHPRYQGRGYAKALMDFAEGYGLRNNYSSIRLDAYSKNEKSLNLYQKRGYQKMGEVFFPGRESPFFCYEKELILVTKSRYDKL
jgi:ribosomal protein S18 acetylase RimI-like enzyme